MQFAELVLLDKADITTNRITTLTSTNGQVGFGGAIHNANNAFQQDLMINAANYSVKFAGSVGDAAAASGALRSLVVNSPLTRIQGGSVTTQGGQHYGGWVVLDKTDTSVDTITTMTTKIGRAHV